MNEVVIDNTSIDYRIVGVKWERIFLTIDVEINSESLPYFKLRRFGRKNVVVDRDLFIDDENVDQSDEAGEDDDLNKDNEVSSGDELDDNTIKIKGSIIREEILINYTNKNNNIYSIEMNITALDDRNFLNNGRWQLVVVIDEEEYVCVYDDATAYQQDNYSRIYRYGNGKYAYNLSFSSYADRSGLLVCVLNSHFMIQNNTWKKRRYVQEAMTIKGKLNRLYMMITIKLMQAYYFVFEKIFRKKGNKVLLMSETKPYLWGNLKAIDDRMKERELDKELNITYSFRTAVGQHQSIFSWLKLITKIAKQDIIFVDDYVPVFGFLNLSKRTKLIQVWHAGEGFKAVGYCRFGKAGTPWPVGSCHKKYDYVVTGSKKLVKVFSEVFGLPEKYFYPLGMARLDGFLDEQRIESFKKDFYKEYPQFADKKIILFAPTFRGTGQKSANYDYSKLDLKEIYDFCKDENYIFLVKMHPFIQKPIEIEEEYQDLIIDFSEFPYINDLYYVTDLLITDYSSNYFEYALMKKPVLFYTYDRVAYELVRGVHRSVKESAPGKVCDTFEEMMLALRNKDFEVEKLDQFVEENFKEYDGQASDKIIDQIILKK